MSRKKGDIIGLIIVLILVIVFGSRYWIEKRSLKKDYQYTIGEVYKIRALSRGGPGINYSFIVNDQIYKSNTWSKKKIVPNIGDRYYVKFSPSNPNNCELLLEKRVPSNIKEAPPEGWKKIPK